MRKMFNQMVLDAFELINDAPVDKGFTALHHIDVQMHPPLCASGYADTETGTLSSRSGALRR